MNIQNPSLFWYSVQVYNTCELSVKEKLETMKKRYNVEYLVEVVAPYENVISISEKKREKNILKKSLYPGYVFIGLSCALPKELHLLCKEIPKLSQIIPVKLSDKDIGKIIDTTNKIDPTKTKYKDAFFPNDNVLIMEGSFLNFKGIIESVDHENKQLMVGLSIFGRQTSVEMPMNMVQKIKD